LAFVVSLASFAQEKDEKKDNLLYKREFSIYPEIHTSGFGIGFRKAYNKTYFRKLTWEIEAVSLKHPKEVRSVSLYNPTKYIIIGKLNQCYIFRLGIGQQHLLNEKPYWGGVELRYFYLGGLSLAITKPIYMKIVKYDSGADSVYDEVEKYDPDKHDITSIYSKASYFKGFDGLKFYPGLFFKTGFNFEFSSGSKTLKYLEFGICADLYYKNVPILAFRNDQFFFSNLFLSLHFGGKRL
jgi:hypothetical protein